MGILLNFDKPRTVEWEKAGITLEIVPLTTDLNNQFIKESTKEILENGKIKRLDRDVVAYSKLIGQHCIKNWTGVFINSEEEQAECTPENIAKAMLIQVFEDFVLVKVFELELILSKEIEAAKKG